MSESARAAYSELRSQLAGILRLKDRSVDRLRIADELRLQIRMVRLFG